MLVRSKKYSTGNIDYNNKDKDDETDDEILILIVTI